MVLNQGLASLIAECIVGSTDGDDRDAIFNSQTKSKCLHLTVFGRCINTMTIFRIEFQRKRTLQISLITSTILVFEAFKFDLKIT